MDIDWLEDFLVLANTGNFSSAAESRNVSQPAFSRRIRSLEQWVGMPLLDRSTYPATLTSSGKILRSTAEETIAALYRSRDACLAERSNDKSEISFSALHTLALTFFPKWLKQSEHELGPAKTRMIAGNVHDCVQSLTLKHSDFLLYYTHYKCPILLDQSNYTSLKLATEQLIPVSAINKSGTALHSFDRKKRPASYLAYSSDTFLGKAVSMIINELDKDYKFETRYSNSMSEALKTMAVEGHGLAWLPKSCATREFQHHELVQIGDAKHCADLEIRLARSVNRLHPEAERFWSWLVRTVGSGD